MTNDGTSGSSGRKVFWRSLEEKERPEQLREQAAGSDIVKQSIDASGLTRLRRRQFLTLSGAISALTGVGGCFRRPVEKIMPYTEMPEDVTVGVASHYASVLTRRGEALGVVVQSSEGWIFILRHLAATSSSMRLYAGGSSQAKPVRSPMTVRVVEA